MFNDESADQRKVYFRVLFQVNQPALVKEGQFAIGVAEIENEVQGG